MQKRPREQRGSIEPTQIARRRLERCLALGRPLLPPRGWPSRHAVHCQSPRCGRAECRGVARDMQERPREQRGSIGLTQIVRRRRERCLGLPHPTRFDPCRGGGACGPEPPSPSCSTRPLRLTSAANAPASVTRTRLHLSDRANVHRAAAPIGGAGRCRPTFVTAMASDTPYTEPGLCVSRVPPARPRRCSACACASRIARTCIARLPPSAVRPAATQLL